MNTRRATPLFICLNWDRLMTNCMIWVSVNCCWYAPVSSINTHAFQQTDQDSRGGRPKEKSWTGIKILSKRSEETILITIGCRPYGSKAIEAEVVVAVYLCCRRRDGRQHKVWRRIDLSGKIMGWRQVGSGVNRTITQNNMGWFDLILYSGQYSTYSKTELCEVKSSRHWHCGWDVQP